MNAVPRHNYDRVPQGPARSGRRDRSGERSFRRLLTALAVTAGVLCVLGIASVAMPAQAQAADPVGCNYAQSGTGRYADTICWIDFSSFDNPTARSAAGQPMSLSLPGGYTATFVVEARPVAGYADISSCIADEPLPFWTFSLGPPATSWPLGALEYRNIAGRPGLLNTNGVPPGGTFPPACRGNGTGADLILSNIQVRDAVGQPVPGYGIVSTEAEASTHVGGEGIVWRSDRTLSLLDTINPRGGGCVGGRVTGFGTSTVTCAGLGGASYGTSLVFAESPTFFSTASVNPSGILGTTYGFVTSKLRLNKVADQLQAPSDSFNLAVSAGSTVLGSGATNGALTGTTGEVTILTGGSFDLAETGAAGTDLANYNQSWACNRNGVSDPSLSSTGNTSKAVTPGVGDFIDCTVTNNLKRANLSIVKSATPSPAVPGTNETYTLVVRNSGPDAARNVRVSDPLARGLTFVSASQGCTFANGSVSCVVASLAAGASQTFTVTARIGSAATGCSEIENTGTVTSDTFDPDAGNNRSTVCPPIEPLADLAIVKRALSNRLVPGREIEYELVVTNSGPSAARDVRVSDPLPRGLSFISASRGCTFASGTVTCTAASLDSGRSLTFRVVTRVAANVTEESVTNIATVESPTRDPDPRNNRDRETVPSGPEADLSITKTPSVDRVAVGGQLFYTLVIRNDGPSDAHDVVVTDDAGAGLTLLSARGSQGASCSTTASRVTCRLGTLAVGGTAQVLVSARADRAGELTNSVTVESPTEDPDPRNNRDERRITGDPGPQPQPADLEIVKTSNRRAILGSENITYTLRVRNNGPGVSTGVQVVDTPSLPIKIVSIRSSVGRCTTTLPIRCDLGTLQVGASVTISVVAQPKAPGTLRNSASVTGDLPDSNARNNIDGTATSVQGLLRIRKTASTSKIRAGGSLSYRITVTNASSFALRSVRVCDDLPAGLAFVSANPKATLSKGQHCWTVRTLGAKKSKTFTVRVRVLRGTSGRKVNTATATAPNARGARSRAAADTAPIQVIAGVVRAGGVTG